MRSGGRSGIKSQWESSFLTSLGSPDLIATCHLCFSNHEVCHHSTDCPHLACPGSKCCWWAEHGVWKRTIDVVQSYPGTPNQKLMRFTPTWHVPYLLPTGNCPGAFKEAANNYCYSLTADRVLQVRKGLGLPVLFAARTCFLFGSCPAAAKKRVNWFFLPLQTESASTCAGMSATWVTGEDLDENIVALQALGSGVSKT